MYKKNKMLSAIAAIAVLSSGAIAFDTNPDGDVISAKDGCNKDHNAAYIGSYDANVAATPITDLKRSSNMKGDALIYPAFNGRDGWESEIVVRNVKNKAIVAKAVLYRMSDSAELLDFNIYLSPHDVARFKIKDGKVTTKDYSIIGSLNGEGVVSNPSDGAALDEKVIAFNQEYFDKEKVVGELNKELNVDTTNGNMKDKGYVVIYGMMETNNNGSQYHTNTKVFSDNDKVDVKKDANGHRQLFLDYRKALDVCRPGWREAFKGNNMKQGMMTIKVASPSLHESCDDAIFSDDGFTSTSKDAFLGTVEISHPNGDERNLLLNATALENFTVDEQMMIWAEGEYAAIQDRRLTATSSTATTKYDTAGIVKDADTFLIKRAYYTYKIGDSNNTADPEGSSNTLLITQPNKRPLIQIGDPADYWQEDSCHNTGSDTWGYFQFAQKIYDEDEREYAEEAGLVTLTSPYTTNRNDDPYRLELQPIRNLEETGDAKGDYFAKETNGYIDITILNNSDNKIPGIVTQMTNSKMSNEAQINWIYAPVDEAN